MVNELKTYKEKLLKCQKSKLSEHTQKPQGFLIDPKLLLIIILALMIAIIIAEPNFKGKISFNIEDKCGRFVNLMSHTIEDETACKTRCRAQCESLDSKYRKIEFEKSETSCNSCVCYCK